MSIGPKYDRFTAIKKQNTDILDWLVHIGAKGRNETLGLSVAHAKMKLVVAGQYSTGGQNYWDSPDAFNNLLLEYVHTHFAEIRSSIEKTMALRLKEARAATRDELLSALGEIEAAA